MLTRTLANPCDSDWKQNFCRANCDRVPFTKHNYSPFELSTGVKLSEVSGLKEDNWLRRASDVRLTLRDEL
jgi:hypothetical protein